MRKYPSSIYLSLLGLALLIGSSSSINAERGAIAGSHVTTNELSSSRREDELGRRSIRRRLKTSSETARTDTNTKATKKEQAPTDDDFKSPLSTSPKKGSSSSNGDASLSSSATIPPKDPVSIASRTTSIEISIKSTLSPEERGIHFVDPQTASPSAMPPAKNETTNSSSSSGSGSSNNNNNNTNTSTSSSSTAPSAKTTTTKAVSTMNSTSGTTSNDTSTDDEGKDEDDDSIASPQNFNSTTGTNPSSSSSYLYLYVPKEKDQPDSWPEIVGCIFVLVAIGLCSITVYNSNQKRKSYQEIPAVSLTV